MNNVIGYFYSPGSYLHEVVNMTPEWRYYEFVNVALVAAAVALLYVI